MSGEPDAGRRLSIEDLFAIRWLSDVRLSPDGRRVACVEARLDEAADGMRSRILVIDLGSGEETSPASGAPSDVSPRWAADGSRLAFIGVDDGGGRIWLAEADGATPHALAGCPTGAVELAWHPDGGRLAVVRRSEDPAPTDRAGPLIHVAGLPYKRDGRSAVGSVETSLSILGLDGTLTPVAATAGLRRPTWSPDGGRLAFIAASDEGDRTRRSAAIFVARDGSGAVERLTPGDGPATAFDWSPEGDRIAWLGRDADGCVGLVERIRVIGVNGSGPTEVPIDGEPALGLTVRSDDARGLLDDATLRWVRVGAQDRLYTRWAEGGRGPLGWSGLDGRLVRAVEGDRSVLSFDLDVARSRVAFIAASVDDPGELSVCDLDGGAERPMSRRNASWRAGVGLGRTEPIAAVAPDGQPLEAWLLRPPRRADEARVPVVLSIHGGPHYPVGWRFSFEHHRLAAEGYAVLTGNPRGSAGYGDAFTTAIHDDWGGPDHDDLMAMLDAALQRPGLDPDRVAVTGVSYGGYMTLWATTRTRRFRAAICENGLSDLTSAFGTSHDGGALLGTELGGPPWELPERYAERSPLRHADRVRTPLLLLHAELDQVCPIGQGEEMFTALRRLGREVSFVRVPGHGHLMDIEGSARFRRARADLVDGWLATHLGPRREAGPASP